MPEKSDTNQHKLLRRTDTRMGTRMGTQFFNTNHHAHEYAHGFRYIIYWTWRTLDKGASIVYSCTCK